MSDVSGATSEPDLSPAAFGMPEEGEIRTPVEQDPAPASSETASPAETVPQEAGAEPDPYAEAPEFWSKERKALYAKITDPDVRKAIHEQEAEGRAAVSRKMEEAANEKKSAAEKLQQYETERDQLAAWWRDTGPRLASAFRSKWETVDWRDMAENNPAEYVKQQEAYKQDIALIQQAAQQNEQAQRAASERAARAERENRRNEHEKLAKALPEAFGKPDVAQKTYDELRDYLMEQGVPGDRIPNIYESFVVTVAYKSMLYDKAQKAAAASQLKPSTTATQTPRRIAPGASNGSQPDRGEAYRQASERLKNGEKLNDRDVALLFA